MHGHLVLSKSGTSRSKNQPKEGSDSVSLTDHLTATHLHFIDQEAVHNAVKQGKPRNTWIGLQSNASRAQSVNVVPAWGGS
jgi:hypothetical protein